MGHPCFYASACVRVAHRLVRCRVHVVTPIARVRALGGHPLDSRWTSRSDRRDVL
jgi:hypothetical protein